MTASYNRRQFLRQSGAILTLPAWTNTRANESTDLIRTIYSNDTTHILSCQRPEQRADVFTDELLRKSIVEAAEVDAHFLQPGLGWIPWWKSEIYPIEEHYRWLQDKFDIKGIRKVDRYLLEGGDMLQTLVDTCRGIGVAPFLSYRLNDGHHVRDLEEALSRGRPTQNMARHYWENYEAFRLGPDVKEWDDGVFDWSIPEVRDYKFAQIEEACSNYDLTGLELDFLRHWKRFGSDTPSEERFAITTEFVGRVRKMLDRTARERGLPQRHLCVRVPANAKVRPEQGVDLKLFAKAGVDMINLSYSYFTWQDDSVRAARAEVGDVAAVFAEMTHCTMTGKATAGSGTQPFLRTTDEQFYTTTRMAHEQGAQGVSLFNFPYYRYHVTDTIGPFHEPPFHVLPKLRDPRFLEDQSLSLFLSSGRNDDILGEKALPLNLKREESSVFHLPAPSEKGRRKEATLRLRSDEPIDDRLIDVSLNGQALKPIPPITSPLPHPYEDTWIGKPDELACFSVPASLALSSDNKVEVTVREGARVRLTYLDLTRPA